ncbi:N2,N2-dimethylguanosine tRNA methyltransferase-domain-containing protein [Boeremia exigua]|uniref:N2,N2-dimethylguanosine tRNA methyltransferase-domain-containing protein n=1 Tax=Boeremia exigua TaxID=749465 RepID=UPI001E8EC53D|nr:N2,N2-dimethylguanosine tRNA methyltransferase-domain-containing protein [Boeremia exigua]KAH6616405.1 N2,N2-dimethylguanosine tRNA methyltransferase-domain-containing protein [Boeremia exigua]
MAHPDAPMADAQAKTIDATPHVGQTISHEGKEYTTIKEGLAHILVPHDTPTSTDPRMSKEDTQKQQVFYNPIQQFNRDLSVLAIKTFGLDSVQRKQDRHAKQLKKGPRKQKAQRKEAAEGPAEEVEETVDETAAEDENTLNRNLDDENTLKRKLAQDETDDGAAPAKKQKVIENGHVLEEGEVAETQADAKEPRPWRAPFTILDALSATGLRALRYAKEIPFATSITSNDMSTNAVESIKLNIKHNKLEDTIKPNTGNAIAYMYSYCDKNGYDVIDLDPYGTAAPFIDSAIQAITDDGLLCVTCTDSAIFASHGYLEKTYSQYGGLPFKGEACHEGGVRLVLHAIASSAARYGMAIEPLLSLSIDYYLRVFVRVRKAPNDVKLLAGKTMLIYSCDNGCGAWTTQFLARNKVTKNKKGDPFYKHGFAAGPSADEHCKHCGIKTHIVGPMYGGPIHNVGFVERVLAQLNEVDRETYPTMDRIEGMLRTALDEITLGTKRKDDQSKQMLSPLIPKADPAEIDHHPFFFIPSSISRVLHCSAPPYSSPASHCKPGSLKTDASWTDIWHIMTEWIRQKAPLKNPLKENTAGRAIMSKPCMSPVETKGAAKDAATVEKPTAQDGEAADVEMANTETAERPSYLGTNFEVNFDEKLGRDHDRGKYVRYQLAPRENWGPMARAK